MNIAEQTNVFNNAIDIAQIDRKGKRVAKFLIEPKNKDILLQSFFINFSHELERAFDNDQFPIIEVSQVDGQENVEANFITSFIYKTSIAFYSPSNVVLKKNTPYYLYLRMFPGKDMNEKLE